MEPSRDKDQNPLPSRTVDASFCSPFHKTLDRVLKLIGLRKKPMITNSWDCPETQSLEANK